MTGRFTAVARQQGSAARKVRSVCCTPEGPATTTPLAASSRCRPAKAEVVAVRRPHTRAQVRCRRQRARRGVAARGGPRRRHARVAGGRRGAPQVAGAAAAGDGGLRGLLGRLHARCALRAFHLAPGEHPWTNKCRRKSRACLSERRGRGVPSVVLRVPPWRGCAELARRHNPYEQRHGCDWAQECSVPGLDVASIHLCVRARPDAGLHSHSTHAADASSVRGRRLCSYRLHARATWAMRCGALRCAVRVGRWPEHWLPEELRRDPGHVLSFSHDWVASHARYARQAPWRRRLRCCGLFLFAWRCSAAPAAACASLARRRCALCLPRGACGRKLFLLAGCCAACAACAVWPAGTCWASRCFSPSLVAAPR